MIVAQPQRSVGRLGAFGPAGAAARWLSPSTRALAARVAASLALVMVAGCPAGDDLVWEQFNADGDQLEIEVGVAELGPPVSIDLHSSTGQHIIGEAVVDPGRGPVGTLHTLVVTVSDSFDPDLSDDHSSGEPIVELVERVSVEVDSGARGVQEWDLRQDSAAPQTWVLELESLGEPDEAPRTDVFTIFLWEAVPAEEEVATVAEETGT